MIQNRHLQAAEDDFYEYTQIKREFVFSYDSSDEMLQDTFFIDINGTSIYF